MPGRRPARARMITILLVVESAAVLALEGDVVGRSEGGVRCRSEGGVEGDVVEVDDGVELSEA